MTKQDAINDFYKCKHVTEQGTDAFMNFGNYGEGYEQCLLCGEVKCTVPDEEDNKERAGYPTY